MPAGVYREAGWRPDPIWLKGGPALGPDRLFAWLAWGGPVRMRA